MCSIRTIDASKQNLEQVENCLYRFELTIHCKPTDMDMNVNAAAQGIHQNIVQVFSFGIQDPVSSGSSSFAIV